MMMCCCVSGDADELSLLEKSCSFVTTTVFARVLMASIFTRVPLKSPSAGDMFLMIFAIAPTLSTSS